MSLEKLLKKYQPNGETFVEKGINRYLHVIDLETAWDNYHERVRGFDLWKGGDHLDRRRLYVEEENEKLRTYLKQMGWTPQGE